MKTTRLKIRTFKTVCAAAITDNRYYYVDKRVCLSPKQEQLIPLSSYVFQTKVMRSKGCLSAIVKVPRNLPQGNALCSTIPRCINQILPKLNQP